MFNVISDKHTIAEMMLTEALYSASRVSSPESFTRQVSAIEFIFEERKLVDVQPHRKSYPEYDMKGEDRPEVFEIIEIIKTMIKLKVFW